MGPRSHSSWFVVSWTPFPQQPYFSVHRSPDALPLAMIPQGYLKHCFAAGALIEVLSHTRNIPNKKSQMLGFAARPGAARFIFLAIPIQLIRLRYTRISARQPPAGCKDLSPSARGRL